MHAKITFIHPVINAQWLHAKFGLLKDHLSTLGVHYRDLQARVHEQETRNLTLCRVQCLISSFLFVNECL